MKDLISTSCGCVNQIREFLGRISPEVLQDMLYIKRIRGEGEVIKDAWSTWKKGDHTVFSSVATGMTKIVLFPKDREDIVFKIPYFGSEVYMYTEDGLELYDTVEFSDKVDGDYCKQEERLFKLAEKSHVDMFFARTSYLTTLLGFIPLYVSERCKAFEDSCEERRYSLLGDTGVPPDIGVMLAERYTGNELDRLSAFLRDNSISDLHSGNWGISRDGNVKILDYSGFFEDIESS